MSETEQIDLGKLAKEIVASRLKDIADTAPVAAEIAHKTIVAGVHASRATGKSAQRAVQEVCRGTLYGLLLIDKDLNASAMAILDRLPGTAQDIKMDPQELLTWALEGMSKVSTMMNPGALWKLREQINEKFMGVGELFDKMCEKAREEKK